MKTAIVWFRQDLRLADNPALNAATQECDSIIPLFIAEQQDSHQAHSGKGKQSHHTNGLGGLSLATSSASHVWLHHSLQTLDKQLRAKGTKLLITRGDPAACLKELIHTHQVSHVYWNRRYDPAGIDRDTSLKKQLGEHCKVNSYNGNLLSEPWTVLKKDDTPYRVFTAFWKTKLKIGFDLPPLPVPARIPGPDTMPDGLSIDELGYLPSIRWDKDMMTYWSVGEEAAHQRLSDFLDAAAGDYKTARDIPAQAGTSRLSPHLHFGEISPRQVLYAAEARLAEQPGMETGIRCFLSEIGWREFAYYLLYHFPQTVSKPLDQRFMDFVWDNDHQAALQRWQQGQTGFPIIDAGMRELWATGWMHNRVRMVVASLLTKNLLIHWQQGEQWFRDTLVDADLASNTLGWQWVAGCGADAAPFFRIFNPLLQSERFDKNGDYIRRWVPELRDRSNKEIHQPRQSGDGLTGYPLPLVDLKQSRARALEHFAAIKTGNK